LKYYYLFIRINLLFNSVCFGNGDFVSELTVFH